MGYIRSTPLMLQACHKKSNLMQSVKPNGSHKDRVRNIAIRPHNSHQALQNAIGVPGTLDSRNKEIRSVSSYGHAKTTDLYAHVAGSQISFMCTLNLTEIHQSPCLWTAVLDRLCYIWWWLAHPGISRPTPSHIAVLAHRCSAVHRSLSYPIYYLASTFQDFTSSLIYCVIYDMYLLGSWCTLVRHLVFRGQKFSIGTLIATAKYPCTS